MIDRPAWCEADAAIAHDCRGDAVLRGRRDVLAPGDLAVIMGVYVDETGRDQFALGVDLFLAFAQNLADFGDAAARDGDVGLVEVAALAVGNVAAADHDVRGRGQGDSSRLWRGGASSDVPGCCQPAGARFRHPPTRVPLVV